jgi:hypothetical protein
VALKCLILIFIEVMLLKEILAISFPERSYIVDYVNGLQRILDHMKRDNRMISWPVFKHWCNYLSDLDLFQGEYRFKMPVKLEVDTKSYTRGQLHHSGEEKYKISLNLVRFLDFREEPIGTWWVKDIDYSGIRSTLAHEIIHFRQRHNKVPHNLYPFSSKKSYIDRGYEQGAWGAGAYESILHYLEPFANGKRLAPYVLQFIRFNGFSDKGLQKLKSENLSAWKKIMKKAVLIALQDMKSSDKLPWQKNPHLPE